MRGRPAAGRLAALVLGILITAMGFANAAHAFEWDLPGERKFSIHGFYEARLLFTGEDLPANAITFSQFRHVLSLEFELSLFPDGFGPFDTMFMFTRVLASFDCIYTRACGMFHAADSYGDAARSAVRQPGSLKENVVNKSAYFAGLLKQVYVPGTLAPATEVLNPSRRYRQCDNAPGVFQNPFPLSVLCNLNQRSPLDLPLKPGLLQEIAVRGGDFSSLSRELLLTAARPTIGETEFARLRALLVGGNVLSISQESERRALLAEAADEERAGNKSAADALIAQASGILGTPQTSFNANIPELLKTRPDPNRFAIFAKASTPELLTSKWGSNKIGTTITPYLATINTPINPRGYFANVGALDWVGQYEAGLADDIPVRPTGGPSSTDADGVPVINLDVTPKKADPFFVGPDGIRNTADDLPFVAKNPAAQAEGFVLANPISGTPQDRFDQVAGSGVNAIPVYSATAQITLPSAADPNVPKTVELYGVYSQKFLALQGCQVNVATGLGLGGTFNRQTGVCTDSKGNDITAQAIAQGCHNRAVFLKDQQFSSIGTNADGDCIEVNTNVVDKSTQQLQYEVLGLYSDPNVRPKGANTEPTDSTDLRMYGNRFGFQIPARPRQKGNGLFVESPGARAFYAQHQAVVSNLDLHFTEDELQWNHGASQHEDEFAEGYLEFEMADSQVFARVGKLIVIWGKTELFRNQDRNNPLDIGNGLFGPLDEQRVGQWAADVTISPEMFMRVGPVEDLRLELLWIFDKFTPTDLGQCGEGGAVDLICLKSFGAMATGLAGIGIAGERRPDKDYNGLATWDYGARMEGRWDRFTFALSDFWGWDDGFYLDLVQQYERTADTTTGAPLSTTTRAGGTCTIRRNAKGQAVGPDGIPGNGDDIFPSAGNCLLWDKPNSDPNSPDFGRQHLRSPDAVAALHNVNQTLFHSICSFTFDQDNGYCAFDQVNNPDIFDFVSKILAGNKSLGQIVLDGVPLIRTAETPFDTIGSLDDEILAKQFLAVNPRVTNPGNDVSQDLGAALQPEQAALLGCGAAYASPCSNVHANIWSQDPSIRADLARDPGGKVPGIGGLDLMNADGSVVTQEFVGVKALEPGALVGTRLSSNGKLTYLPGINYSRNGTFTTVPDPSGGIAPAVEIGCYLTDPNCAHSLGLANPLTPDRVIAMGRVGRALFQKTPLDPKDPNSTPEADGWVEPMPWQVDKAAMQKWGAIVFENDPNDPLSLTSPLNKWNLIDKRFGPSINSPYDNVDGEYCARWMNRGQEADFNTPFNAGCTVLETASANFERFLIAQEIIGFDRQFDPPESLTELVNWGSGNFATHLTGDPIAGPDGIFTRNSRVFDQTEDDFQVIRDGKPDAGAVVVAPADPNTALQALKSYDPASCPTQFCFFDVTSLVAGKAGNTGSNSPLIIDMPISYSVNMVDDPNNPVPTRINLAKLEQDRSLGGGLTQLRELFARQVVTLDGHKFQMTLEQHDILFGDSRNLQAPHDNFFIRDLNGDTLSDLDQNHDGIWDGQDDYTPGPITDDNILCGSGLRGDPLEEAAQYEPYRVDEAPGSAKFKTKFPNGLPPRSPVFCKSIAGILGGTAQTLPVRKAGGDGTFGRRDFLWQSGRVVDLRYQKKNVFGFGLDFAEDVSKTSWGIEFSWMARKLFANSTTFSGLSQSDELVLSVSVDRPTFFNFLNPNRSFFINLQMFLRYLPNYQGGTLNRDGLYGTAKNPFSGNIVLTVFTGYFQDRLAPRVSILWAPEESQGAVITGLSYRWNDAFSTTIGYSNFFGHVYNQQGAYFPIAQYSSPEVINSAVLGRGVAPVINRDQAELRFRYTW